MGERTPNAIPAQQSAHRLLSMLMRIASSQGGVTTTQLHDAYFADMKPDTQKKTLKRCIETLESFGVVFDRASEPGRPTRLSVSSKTWADLSHIDDKSSLLLDLQCQPLVSDPSFNLTEDLASALAKMRPNRLLGTNTATAKGGVGATSSTFKLLQACVSHMVCKVSYRGADGVLRERELEPLGEYNLRDHTYFVCAKHRKDEDPRVYRSDRFEGVTLTRTRFEPPEGFAVEDYIKLPFQIGTPVGTACLCTTEHTRETLASLVGRQGKLSEDGRSATVEYASAKEAAAWAVAQGLVPTEDQAVVNAWSDIVERSMR